MKSTLQLFPQNSLNYSDFLFLLLVGKKPKTDIVSFFLSLLIFYAKSLKYLCMLGKVIFCQNGIPSDEQPTLFLVTSKTNE